MTYSDIPHSTRYNWEALLSMPRGKALRTEYPTSPLYIAENARSAATGFCKKHGIRCRTKRVREGDVEALYIWIV